MITVYEGLSLAVAGLALLLSGYAVWNTARLQRRQVEEIEAARSRRQQADVSVSLVAFADRNHFVIENRGDGTAYDVRLQIEPPQGKRPPIPKGELERKVPIQVLRSGSRVEIVAALSQDTGYIFDVGWCWKDEDGRPRNREERLSRLAA